MRKRKDEEEKRLVRLRMHEAIDMHTDKSVEELRANLDYSEADIEMMGRVQREFMHTVIDLRTDDRAQLANIEHAITALMVNQITLFIRGALPDQFGDIALKIADRMIQRLENGVYQSLCTTYQNTGEEPTDGDSIH